MVQSLFCTLFGLLQKMAKRTTYRPWLRQVKTEQEAIFGHVSKRLSDHDQRRGGDRTSQTLEEVEANTEIRREERERMMGW